jgi:hypothetical protein
MNDHQNPPGPDLEARLSTAMRAEAENVTTDPAALALIRQRTAAAKRRPAGAWFFRPAVAGGALAFTLVLGTLVGVNLANDDGGDSVIADPAATALSVAGKAPAPQAEAADAGDRAMSKAAPEADAAAADAKTMLVPTPEAAVTPNNRTELGVGGGPAEATPVHKMPVDTGGSYVSITAPDSGILVERTFELRGFARTFEANVVIEVSQNGKVVKRDYATASAGAPEKGEWTKKLTLEPGNYRIDAFEESMKGDGKKLASDTIWLTVVGTTSGGGSDSSSEGPADPVAVPAEDGSAVEPQVDPAAAPAEETVEEPAAAS